MKCQIVSGMLVIAVCFIAARVDAEDKAKAGNAQAFAALKKLAGDWVEVKDGKPTDKVVSSFRVTSGGSAVQETIFPGTEKEMVTMYHLDGADLVLTHYCMLGNQPRMRAEPGAEPNRIAFKFTGGGNMKSANDRHMDHATLTILGDDHFQAEWGACADGQECHTVRLDLVRKQK